MKWSPPRAMGTAPLAADAFCGVPKGGRQYLPIDVGDGEVTQVTDTVADEVGVGGEAGVYLDEGRVLGGHHLEVGGGFPVSLGRESGAELVGGGYIVGHAEYAEHAGRQLLDKVPVGAPMKVSKPPVLGVGPLSDGHYGLVTKTTLLSIIARIDS